MSVMLPGMGADLYESYVGSIISAGALAAAAFSSDASLSMIGVIIPMMIAAIGIISSIIGTFFVSTAEGASQKNLLGSLRRGTYISSILSAAGLGGFDIRTYAPRTAEYSGR